VVGASKDIADPNPPVFIDAFGSSNAEDVTAPFPIIVGEALNMKPPDDIDALAVPTGLDCVLAVDPSKVKLPDTVVGTAPNVKPPDDPTDDVNGCTTVGATPHADVPGADDDAVDAA
jgi:hypothetical protein